MRLGLLIGGRLLHYPGLEPQPVGCDWVMVTVFLGAVAYLVARRGQSRETQVQLPDPQADVSHDERAPAHPRPPVPADEPSATQAADRDTSTGRVPGRGGGSDDVTSGG